MIYNNSLTPRKKTSGREQNIAFTYYPWKDRDIHKVYILKPDSTFFADKDIEPEKMLDETKKGIMKLLMLSENLDDKYVNKFVEEVNMKMMLVDNIWAIINC